MIKETKISLRQDLSFDAAVQDATNKLNDLFKPKCFVKNQDGSFTEI